MVKTAVHAGIVEGDVVGAVVGKRPIEYTFEKGLGQCAADRADPVVGKLVPGRALRSLVVGERAEAALKGSEDGFGLAGLSRRLGFAFGYLLAKKKG